jgi:TFIIF-interacting CTD phosphatase-like protein
MYIEPRPFAK